MKTPISATAQTYTGPEPTNFSDLLRLTAANTTYEWDDTGSVAIVVGPTAPTDLTATWFVTASTFHLPVIGQPPPPVGGGQPLGMKRYYAGAWRFVYPGPNDHELVYFAGNWASYFNVYGLGLAGTGWEGYALCLGNYGTPNLANRFIVAGYRCDGAFAWVTKISAGQVGGGDLYSGGVNTKTLTVANLPKITWPVKVQQGFLGSGQGQPPGVPLGSTDTWAGSGGLQSGNVIGGYLGAVQPITTVPPFIALAVAMWVGY